MKVFPVVGVILLVVILYFFSALILLPWYIYPPFIALFVVVFYWNRLGKYIPLNIFKTFTPFRSSPSARKNSGGGRRGGRGRGKRM